MDQRLAKRLALLYPPEWRARYAEEFIAFLEGQPLTLGAVLDVACFAIRERVSSEGHFSMNGRQQSLALMAWSYLLAIPAGLNFYWIIDDTPVVGAMRLHPAFARAHFAVAWGSFAAFAAVGAIALPVLATIVRKTGVKYCRALVGQVAIPFVTTAVILGWLLAATYWGFSRWGVAWVPTPWDVNPVLQPAGWPPLNVRLALSSVTLALLIIGLLVTGRSIARVIRDADLTRSPHWWFTITATTFAVSLLVMTVGIGSWGWLAERYAADTFNAGDGLLIDVSMAQAWLVSAAVFASSSVIALWALRCTFRHD